MADVKRTDIPTIEDESRPFWDGAAEGRLLLGYCNSCDKTHHYPRPFCPTCWSEDVKWVDASGKATLYTWSTVFFNNLAPFDEQLPYVAAVVDLEEGPRLMTNIVEVDPDSLEIGMALEVTFKDLNGEVKAPVFRPSS